MSQTADSVLRRMATRATADSAEDPADRRMALGFARAADRALGLFVEVGAVRFDRPGFDEALGDLTADAMLVRLDGPGSRIALCAIGQDLRAAAVEMQTTGRLGARAAESRPSTAADLALCLPLLDRWLGDLAGLAPHSPIAAAAPGFHASHRIAGLRAARVTLEDCGYFRLAMQMAVGHDGRSADIVFLWPDPHPAHHHEPPVETPHWTANWHDAVRSAPVELDAMLHRMRLPLAVANALGVGSVLPLPGVTVHSVRLVAGDGRTLATARLGQSGGMRAVRIEPPPQTVLSEAVPRTRLSPSG